MLIYLDVLIIENAIVNTFLLYITSQTLMKKVKFRYIIIAGTIGGMYVCTLIFPSIRFFSGIIFKIITAEIMIYITFRNKNVLFNIRALVILIIYSMTLAGVCMFLNFSQSQAKIFDIDFSNISYRYLMVGIMILYMLIFRIITFVKDRKDVFNLIYRVDIGINNTEKSIRAFLDTGNELREPISNLPVMVIERKSLGNIILDDRYKCYIKYKVVDGKIGRLEAFKPAYIKIYVGNKAENKDMVIALSDNKLSEYNEYTALLPRGCI
ncbi:sigma-E processing peptidase SpoIIGA [Clostridium neuense]|uniref:Sporulation sigma-E factor-processing peptidase n=1 Tax=Clostridium neuense TaxID=1728934 RepID=A0ABW8TDY4_9CLOT